MKNYHFTDEDIELATSINIIDFLSSKGYKLKKKGSNTYLLEPHSSLVIFSKTNSWYYFKDNKGDNLINFLQYYENKSFQETMLEILGESENRQQISNLKFNNTIQQEEKKEIVLPEANTNNDKAFTYLTEVRGIDKDIVNKFILDGDIYENNKGGVVFLGKDKENNVKFASVRGTNSNFKQDIKNSDKNYSFKMTGTSKRLFVFEAPIDLLSHLTLSKIKGENWEKDNRISLSGVSDKSLNNFLKENPNIEEITLFLDNDIAGLNNAKKIFDKYKDKYKVKIFNSTKGKDLNEMLLNYKEEVKSNRDINLKDFVKEINPSSIKLEENSQLKIKNNEFNNLKNKYQETLDKINSKKEFKSLLDTMIKFNKYSFDNIVLIHNQNPNAEFLATSDIWNNKVGININKNARGIGILELDSPTSKYKYLF